MSYKYTHVHIASPLLVPDIHIDGTLSAVHLMLDKRQLDTIKGLIDMNLGEGIEEFEKPSSVILDPVAQVRVFSGCLSKLVVGWVPMLIVD